MAGDEELDGRIRAVLADEDGFSEKRMFGGVCYMIDGNMCVGSWKGSLIVRLSRAHHERTLAEPHTRPFDVTGRVMTGWALVEAPGFVSDEDLTDWVYRAVDYVRSLLPK
ncbi:MAG: TfoX/Sxy family protein [Gemmatimonadota bacterium]|nr:TfoX/Sxy family protein [Gemmatimonadota bacterium]